MAILGYLALPAAGKKAQLCDELATIRYCEAVPSDNREVVLLVTDTPDQEAEKRLQRELKRLNSLQALSMVFGHTAEPENREMERKP
ncbi:hypothetical protein ACHHRT_11265 [Desulfurivibrio sp. D14AmB]|uniref:hypothetical protein n=1 Tax=Desulfurivibrio sp. D14AmB TaxID=3374370 RepID=UPI00376EBD96